MKTRNKKNGATDKHNGHVRSHGEIRQPAPFQPYKIEHLFLSALLASRDGRIILPPIGTPSLGTLSSPFEMQTLVLR